MCFSRAPLLPIRVSHLRVRYCACSRASVAIGGHSRMNCFRVLFSLARADICASCGAVLALMLTVLLYAILALWMEQFACPLPRAKVREAPGCLRVECEPVGVPHSTAHLLSRTTLFQFLLLRTTRNSYLFNNNNPSSSKALCIDQLYANFLIICTDFR